MGCWRNSAGPSTGISPSSGSEKCGRSGSFSCTYLMPAKAEKPAPNRLNARPVAYWLVFIQITSTPKAAASSAPAPMPARKPIVSLPVCTTAAKPAMAEQSIMPSAPRLTMPDFSLINSPRAAMASTVPALSMEAKSSAYWSMDSGLGRSGVGKETQAIDHQRVAGQQREQEQALEHAGQGLGQAQAGLGEFAADVE